MRIALFVPCYTDTLFPEAAIATVRLLERLGHEMEFHEEQTCCGQIHANSGYERDARRLARRFVEIFEPAEVVVAPSASCVGTVRETYERLGDPELAAAASRLAPRVFELSELLVKRLGVDDVGASYPGRVAYHPTCHSLRAIRVGEAPLRLLRNVSGLELVELDRAEECCGFGGTFAVKNPDVSAAMLATKVAALESSGAEVVTATDGSCLMHIGGGLAKQGAPVRTLHLAEILASGQA
ncbi:MAG TPA: (Fe-S)-binding protein [Gaiellaceae bacterium]